MVVAAGYGTTLEVNYNAAVPPSVVLNQAPEIIVGNNYYAAGTAMTFPTLLDGSPYPRYAAGTFAFTPIPEPAQCVLVGVGLLGLCIGGTGGSGAAEAQLSDRTENFERAANEEPSFLFEHLRRGPVPVHRGPE